MIQRLLVRGLGDVQAIRDSMRRYWRCRNRVGQGARVAVALFAALGVAAGIPAPSGAAAPARPRVALQAGHWKANEAPYPLSIQTGSSAGSLNEWSINLDVAQRTAAILRAEGVWAEVLPTWFQLGYAAEAFVAIHANGSPDTSRRGFFADRSAVSAVPELDDRLVKLLDRTVAAAVPIPFIYRPTSDTQSYYAYAHLTRGTPAALVELGFLTNPDDRAVLTTSTQTMARAIATAIEQFLNGPAKAVIAPVPASTASATAVNVSKAPPTVTAMSGRPGTIRVDWGGGAVLRTRPTRSSAPLAVIPDRETVGVLGTTLGETVEPDADAWNLVQWQGEQGYVYGRQVSTEGRSVSAPSRAPVPESSGTIRVDWGGGAVLRGEPTRDSTPLAIIPERDPVRVIATALGDAAEPGDTTWRLVRWKGQQGYVYAKLVTLQESGTPG